MDKDKASKIYLWAFILLTTFVSLSLFALQIVVYSFIVMFLYPSVKSNLNNVSDLHVKFLLVSFMICKSHFA